MRRSWLPYLVVAACCACSQGQVKSLVEDDVGARVAYQDITVSTAVRAEHLVLADNESFLMPIDEDSNARPIYPAKLLSQRLSPRVVCIQLAITDAGNVASATQAPASSLCPTDAERAFVEAAIGAANAWRFDPALRCVFPNQAAKELAVGSCNGGAEFPQAVSLVYRFQFEQVDGKPSVKVGP